MNAADEDVVNELRIALDTLLTSIRENDLTELNLEVVDTLMARAEERFGPVVVKPPYPVPSIHKDQHCTAEDDVCGYTLSHTAGFCGKPQPRRCGCVWCQAGLYAETAEVEAL